MPSETRRIGLPPARASLPSSFRTVGKEPMSNNQLALNFFSFSYLFIKLHKKNQMVFCWTDEKIQPLFITCWSMVYVVIDGHVFLCLTSMVVAQGCYWNRWLFYFWIAISWKMYVFMGSFRMRKMSLFFLSYFSTKSPPPKMALGMTYRSLPGRH
jgi:hypothetical protein